MPAADDRNTYAVILVHADGNSEVFESEISKERAEAMQAVLLKFIRDVQVVDQAATGD